MGNCKDCKHWTPLWIRNGACSLIKEHDSFAGDPPIKEHEARIFVFADTEDAPDTQLITGPMFGCVQFKAKAGEEK